MLDFVYYPVSGILWIWHTVFGSVLGPDSGVAWALSIVFLVFTIRTVLIRPFVRQIRTQLAMKKLRPRIEGLQKKYADDRVRRATEMRKLQREHGFNPLLSLLPLLVQAPVFIGLFHVLRSFDRTGTGFGGLAMSVQDNANTANYFFDSADVQSFLNARLFGAPISAAIWGPPDSVLTVALVAVPLILAASIATHFNSRASVARQDATASSNPQTSIMNRLALWVFPIGVVIGGPALPIAVLLYWVSNNAWTYVQQHIVYRRMDAEEAAQPRRESTVSAPRPGVKPRRTR